MRRRSTRRGFSLLEVMAAVAILGVWYVTLSGSALSGLRAQGVSERRMRASLVADEVLADLEAQAIDLLSPEIDSDEYEYDEQYTVVFEVSGLADPSGGRAIEPEEFEEDFVASAPDLFAFLADEAPGFYEHTRALQVEVSWDEGGRRLRVLRTSYAFDSEAARATWGEAADARSGGGLGGDRGGLGGLDQ